MYHLSDRTYRTLAFLLRLEGGLFLFKRRSGFAPEAVHTPEQVDAIAWLGAHVPSIRRGFVAALDPRLFVGVVRATGVYAVTEAAE